MSEITIDSVSKRLDAAQVDVTKAVIDMLNERREKGLIEYGRPMQPFIGEPASLHALEETLDHMIYEMSEYLELQEMFVILDDIMNVMNSGNDIERLEAYKAYLHVKERMNIKSI